MPTKAQRGRVAGGLGSVASRLTVRRGLAAPTREGPWRLVVTAGQVTDGPEKGRSDGRSVAALSC